MRERISFIKTGNLVSLLQCLNIVATDMVIP